MSKVHPWQHTDSNSRNRWNPKRLITVAAIILVIVALVILNRVTNDQPAQNEQSAWQVMTPTPTPTESQFMPVCRADGEFVAGFMSPQADDAKTQEFLDRMNTDAVTFGGRIEPAIMEDYPAEVREHVGERHAYEYSVSMHWDGIDLDDQDTTLNVGDTEYGIISAGEDNVVITSSVNSADAFHSLTRVSKQRENQAFIGLPVPGMRTSGDTWLPDNSYADVVDGFAKKFVGAYAQRGADGFYLAMEMPLTDASHWNPVTDYYSRQTQIINEVSAGATVLISPYLEGRKDRETIHPDTAAAGYRKFLELANGTRILVSPQDGLGVGTTALESDESEAHEFTAKDYFEVLHAVDPEHLYVTVEAMRPGGGSPDTRTPTSRERVEEQLSATAPYVQGAIGFQWAEPNSMIHIPHIGHGACAAGPHEMP